MNKIKLEKQTKFNEDYVYVIDSIETKLNQFWVKCEIWNWDGEDVHVFNRPGCFGILESDNGDSTGLDEVIITCKKFKSIEEALKYDFEDDVADVVFNYEDVLNNNFMIAGEFILHQKFADKILGELNPWSHHPESMNKDIYIIFEDGDSTNAKEEGFQVTTTPFSKIDGGEIDSEAQLYKNSSGEKYLKPDLGEDLYDDEENQIDVTFRWYGRVEGCMWIDRDDYGDLNYEHNGVSLDYVQVINEEF